MECFNDFWEFIKYGSPYEEEQPFEYGVYYDLVASTLLNGVINYVNIICATVMCRYTSVEEENELKKYVEEFNKGEGDYHTDLAQFKDDVIILGYEENTKAYWYFYFDCDVSDCGIGRFKTDKTMEDVINLYNNDLDRILKERDDCQRLYYSLNVKNIKGWMKF